MSDEEMLKHYSAALDGRACSCATFRFEVEIARIADRPSSPGPWAWTDIADYVREMAATPTLHHDNQETSE